MSRSKKIIGVGEILWDLLPEGKQLGGAPANFAYHAHALGAQSWPISRVGDDPLGREILEQLSRLGLPSDQITIDPSAPTGTVTIELSKKGQPAYTIHENVAWDGLESTQASRDLAAQADAICFGSLGQRCDVAGQAIRDLVSTTAPEALRVFDINLRQHFYSHEVITNSLALSNVLKINDDELPVIAKMLKLPVDQEEQFHELTHQFGLRVILLTRGDGGSVLYRDGDMLEHPGVTTQVVDTVGAGNAFTAAMVMGLLANWSTEVIQQRANKVAAYVCSQAGATPSLPDDLKQVFIA